MLSAAHTKIPVEHHTVASVLALAGVMRITRVRARICEEPGSYQAELERPIMVNELHRAARARAEMLSDWPADADYRWWMKRMHAALAAGDRATLDTLAMLGSEAVDPETRELTWRHSQWRMIFGQQRWLQMIRKALEQTTPGTIQAWCSSRWWPRTEYMGMTGVDSGSYTPPAYQWSTNTSELSRGHPVSLWLMWEGMHILPSVPNSAGSTYGMRTGGWVSRTRVRWPIWHHFASIEWLRPVWGSLWLADRSLDKKRKYLVEDDDDHSRISVVASRELLRNVGVAAIYESVKTAQPPPYAYRLQSGEMI